MVEMFDSGPGLKIMENNDKAFKSSSQKVFREKEENQK